MLAAVVWAGLIWFIASRVAHHRRVRLIDDALDAGDPRRARAVARFALRRARWFDRPWLTLLYATALFWDGEFPRALLVTRAVLNDREFSGLRGLLRALEIKCVLLAGDHGEARELLNTHRALLDSTQSMGRITSDGAALDALLRVEEGDADAAAALAAIPDDDSDFARIVHWYRARVGDDARAELVAAADGGGDLFVARRARERYAVLFGEAPAPGGIAPRVRRSTVLAHVREGLRLAALRRSAFSTAVFTVDQALALALLNVAIALLVRCVDYSPRAWFLTVAAFAVTAPVLFFAVVSYVATRPLAGGQVLRRRKHPTLHVAGSFYAAMPVLLVAYFIGTRAAEGRKAHLVIAAVLAAWSLAMVARLLRQVAGRPALIRIAAGCLVVAIGWLAPMHAVADMKLWFGEPDRAAASPPDVAGYFLDQGDRLHAAEEALLPERAGVDDLYFLGIAAHGGEDVFSSEVRAARALFDRRFDTAGRSIALANDPGERSLPAVSTASIRHALRAIASRMNREEDILFLFVTSHGSDAGLAIRPSNRIAHMETLAPMQLRGLLDGAGIRWRVLVVAGCQSGVFIDALKTDSTLVMTAAASDRASYGCAPGRPMTEFGRAVFGEQLAEQQSLVRAFTKAIKVLGEREASNKLTPSAPILHVGAAIAVKLERLEHRLFAAAVVPAVQP